MIKEVEKLTETGIDLVNIDLLVIKEKENIDIKLNNLRRYSVLTNLSEGNNSKIFLNGLKSLATYFLN